MTTNDWMTIVLFVLVFGQVGLIAWVFGGVHSSEDTVTMRRINDDYEGF